LYTIEHETKAQRVDQERMIPQHQQCTMPRQHRGGQHKQPLTHSCMCVCTDLALCFRLELSLVTRFMSRMVLTLLCYVQGQRTLDFVLKSKGFIDKTLLIDIELLKIV
jgi:hypothetical protein